MHDADLDCYSSLGFEGDLLDEIQACGLGVARCPYEDPHYKSSSAQEKLGTLLLVREEALRKFIELPKPVLIMCSSGIDRSAPVAAFILESTQGTEYADG